jgi:hypothetical protein
VWFSPSILRAKGTYTKTWKSALFVAVLLLCLSACEQPRGTGAKAPEAPRLDIAAASELAKIGVDPGYPLYGHYTLSADLELTGWMPIGGKENPFTGTFDGGEHTITLLSFASDALRESSYTGIFRYVKNGTIRGFTLAGTMDILWDSSSAATLRAAGGVAGYLDNSRMEDISSSLDVSARSDLGSVYAGGLSGYALGSKISRCHSTGNISVSGLGHNTSAGGVAGYLRKTVVSDCSATGNVRLQAIPPEEYSNAMDYLYMIYAGGLLGYTGDGSDTRRSYATGSVYAESPYPYAGGLVGYNYGDLSGTTEGAVIAECRASGDVTATAVRGGIPYAGGLAGYTSQKGKLLDSYAEGDVEARSGGRLAWAGGIAGSCANSATVSRCYAGGSVRAEAGAKDLPFGGQPGISDGALAGGIAGYVYWNDRTLLENCAALNTSIEAVCEPGGEKGVHLIAGRVDPYAVVRDNIAGPGVSCTAAPIFDADGLDGTVLAAFPTEEDYQALGWDFTTVWKMGGEGYPVLQWQE